MDIEEFVKNVLEQITNAVNKNDSGGNIKYTVDYGKGVDFDLAVTTALTQTEEKGIAGGLKVRVVGAELNKENTTNTHQEQTSRVSFNVNLRKDRSSQQINY